MVSDEYMNSVEIVAFCESSLFNMELTLYRIKRLQCHISMFTMQQKAETKMILIICKVHLRNFLNTSTT